MHTELIVAFAQAKICKFLRKLLKSDLLGAILILAEKIKRFYDVQSQVMTTKYVLGENLQKSMCKTDLLGEYPNFTPFLAISARKIQMSKYLRLLPCLVSQMFVSDEKSWSINVYFTASGNLPYFQLTHFNVLKNNRYITNKIIPTNPPLLKPCCIHLFVFYKKTIFFTSRLAFLSNFSESRLKFS